MASSKGARRAVVSRVPYELYEILEYNRRASGIGSVSQFVADVLAVRFGRSDLVRELEIELLSSSALDPMSVGLVLKPRD